jgi:CubicO group peptidase (beta-lactamase class C family)
MIRLTNAPFPTKERGFLQRVMRLRTVFFGPIYDAKGLKSVCLVMIAFLLSGCSHSSSPDYTYSATIAEGRAAVQEIMTESSASSVSVALVDGDRLIWSEAFGKADREAGRNATTNTLFGICSVSKMLATVATMILVDREKLSLDEPATTYIKNFSMPLDQRYRDITVRMLLNHSSGLPGNDMRGAVTTAPFAGYAAQMMDGLKYQRLKHDPGTISEYNNDGFTMIENLVKAVTGQNYSDFVRENILEPLGMDSSRYQTEPLPEGSYAKAYAGDSKLTLYSFNVYGSGGLFSTPEELSRLAIMLINRGIYGSRRILSEKAVTAMAQDQRLGSFNPVPFEENRFGLGWDTVAQPGLAAVNIASWQKTGDMNGYYGANIAVAPEEKLGVVVFGASNSFDSSYAVKISERILLRALVERRRLAEMPKPLSTTPLPVQAVTQEERNTFTGFYTSGSGVYRLGFGADDSLSLDELRSDWTPKYRNFKLRSDGWYAADGDPITALRLLTRGGRNYYALRLKRGFGHYSSTIMTGQRLDDKPAISAAWQARLGETWLLVNADMILKGPSFQFRTITGLTGYIMGNNILRDMTPPSDDRLDGMFLTLPDGGKDLQEPGIETWNGQKWLRLGSYLYRPLSGIPLLASGPTTVPIGSDGFAEWRQLPASGTLSMNGTTSWFLYDADFNELASGMVSGTPSFSGAGSKYLVLLGTYGTTISLNLTAQ